MSLPQQHQHATIPLICSGWLPQPRPPSRQDSEHIPLTNFNVGHLLSYRIDDYTYRATGVKVRTSTSQNAPTDLSKNPIIFEDLIMFLLLDKQR